jgi:hypothetical protein
VVREPSDSPGNFGEEDEFRAVGVLFEDGGEGKDWRSEVVFGEEIGWGSVWKMREWHWEMKAG